MPDVVPGMASGAEEELDDELDDELEDELEDELDDELPDGEDDACEDDCDEPAPDCDVPDVDGVAGLDDVPGEPPPPQATNILLTSVAIRVCCIDFFILKSR